MSLHTYSQVVSAKDDTSELELSTALISSHSSLVSGVSTAGGFSGRSAASVTRFFDFTTAAAMRVPAALASRTSAARSAVRARRPGVLWKSMSALNASHSPSGQGSSAAAAGSRPRSSARQASPRAMAAA